MIELGPLITVKENLKDTKTCPFTFVTIDNFEEEANMAMIYF